MLIVFGLLVCHCHVYCNVQLYVCDSEFAMSCSVLAHAASRVSGSFMCLSSMFYVSFMLTLHVGVFVAWFVSFSMY